MAYYPDEEGDDESPPVREPQLYLCDDWIQPMAAMSKPRELTAKEKVKANMAKNCLIVTLMSLELGYGSILERYHQESQSIVERYQHGNSESSPVLNSILLMTSCPLEEVNILRLRASHKLPFRPCPLPRDCHPRSRDRLSIVQELRVRRTPVLRCIMSCL